MVNATYKPPLQQQHSSFPSHTMPQIDLAPTLSLLLGLPVPFSSIGKVDAALWRLATGCVEGKTLPVERRQACRAAYRAALHVNAWQVHRYVQAYAAAAKLPRGALERLATLYAAAVDKGAQGDARYDGVGWRLSALTQSIYIAIIFLLTGYAQVRGISHSCCGFCTRSMDTISHTKHNTWAVFGINWCALAGRPRDFFYVGV